MTSIRIRSIWLLAFLAGCGGIPSNPVATQNAPQTVGGGRIVTATGTLTSAASATASPVPAETTALNLEITGAAVAAGRNHACAILSNETVRCWGSNEHGQLGNGGTTDSSIPVDVIGVADAVAIAAGWGHTCILSRSGGVRCWGYNSNGELGNGRTEDSGVPVAASGLSGEFIAIEAGDDHTCAVDGGGGVKCWGYNEFGQLGDGTKASRSIPVTAGGFATGVRSVAAGWGHTCALMDAGGVKCWGNNEQGQLGDGRDTPFRYVPAGVYGLSGGVSAITADGGSACALAAGGAVQCWGNNQYGQLGDGTGQQRKNPVTVLGLAGGSNQVAVGWNHACAEGNSGELYCWGWNYYGQLGDGSTTSKIRPVEVLGLTDGVSDIAAGWGHTCVVTDFGGVKCWGLNESGQLGDGTQTSRARPVAVDGIVPSRNPLRTHTPSETSTKTRIVPPTETPTVAPTGTSTPSPSRTTEVRRYGPAVAVDAGAGFTCALTAAGGVKCWGDNELGEAGDGTLTQRNTPVDVVGLANGVTGLTAGRTFACAVVRQRSVKCWGNYYADDENLGKFINSNVPVEVRGFSGRIVELTSGSGHICALNDSGGVQCLGNNYNGQLGDGTKEMRLTPVQVMGLSSGVIALTAGSDFTCALTEAGGIKCWGDNTYGQLGDGTKQWSAKPVDVNGLTSGVTSVAASVYHVCALTTEEEVKCWGHNRYRQVGDGTTEDRVWPTEVIGLSAGARGLAVGYYHSCAMMSGNGACCWGDNRYGQLGDGTTNDSLRPAYIRLSVNIAGMTAGDLHTCALLDNGGILCWGYNESGQLGNGTNTDQYSPVVVDGFGGNAAADATAEGRLTRTRTNTPAPE